MHWLKHAIPGAALCCVLFASASPAGGTSSSSNWPQWRGPAGNGVAPEGNPPVEWSESKNVKWKVKIPGKGLASPIVWEDRVFVLTAVPTQPLPQPPAGSAGFGPRRGGPPDRSSGPGGFRPGGRRDRGGQRGAGGRRNRGGRGFGFRTPLPTVEHEFTTLCLDRDTGKVIWKRVSRKEKPHAGLSAIATQQHGFASASPVTDGKRLIAFFGSRGLYCYDLDGHPRWDKDFGEMTTANAFGEGSSPALADGIVVVLWDHEGDSFIAGLDEKTGAELWRQDRDEGTSWSTPLVVEYKGSKQVVVNASNTVRGYDLKTGAPLWQCSGQTRNAIPSPVAGEGMVFLMSGFRGNALQAIKLGRTGDLTDTDAIAWRGDRGTPYVPSPLLYDDNLFFCQRNDAIVSSFEASTGKENFSQERLEIRGVYASPVGAAGRIYVTGRDGATAVLKHAARLRVLAVNRLDERFDASPAIAGNELFLRGRRHLYCLAKD